MRATILNNIAEMEEFIQEFYVTNFDQVGAEAKENKVEEITTLKPNWFYHEYSMTVTDKEGHELWLIDKDNFIKDYKKEIRGGDAGDKTYKDYYELNDVYGVTANLKVYYCGPSASSKILDERMYGLKSSELDMNDPNRTVVSSTDTWKGLISNDYDTNGDGNISATEIKYVSTLTITKDSGITDLKNLFQFASLKNLTLDGLTLDSLSGLDTVMGLDYLYLKNIDCADYEAIGSCTDLTTLYVERNNNQEGKDNEQVNKMLVAMKNKDYSGLANFGIFGDESILRDKIVFVPSDISKSSNLSEISDLANLTNNTKNAIKNLYLSSNKITDFSSILNFKQIEELYLQGNPFSNLNFIKNMELLKNLSVGKSGITDITIFDSRNFYKFN